jgi:hypothetical protein
MGMELDLFDWTGFAKWHRGKLSKRETCARMMGRIVSKKPILLGSLNVNQIEGVECDEPKPVGFVFPEKAIREHWHRNRRRDFKHEPRIAESGAIWSGISGDNGRWSLGGPSVIDDRSLIFERFVGGRISILGRFWTGTAFIGECDIDGLGIWAVVCDCNGVAQRFGGFSKIGQCDTNGPGFAGADQRCDVADSGWRRFETRGRFCGWFERPGSGLARFIHQWTESESGDTLGPAII